VVVQTVAESTAAYEQWLAEQLPVVAADLERKHRLMRRDAFTFLRATYYRFVELLPAVAPDLLDAPVVAGVGDLHADNFGTWRDREGRLAWGVNDFDEADAVPYTADLARLATSIVLACRAGQVRVPERPAVLAVLTGYTRGVTDGVAPFVVAERRRWLRALAEPLLHDERRFWRLLQAAPECESPLPQAARTALARSAPGPHWEHALRRRVAGVGSLGRPRFVAVGEWQGALAARELKQLPPPATRFLGSDAGTRPPRLRDGDPFAHEHDGWLAHRLSPDAVKIELARVERRRVDRRLLAAMGRETARIHLRGPAARQPLEADLEARGPSWLATAAARLAQSVEADFADWRAAGRPARTPDVPRASV
jgi:Uncharacterized protein conserved in bacteria (DUF2252)